MKRPVKKRRTLRSRQSTQDDKKSRSAAAQRKGQKNGALRLQEGRRPRHLRKRSSSDAQGRWTALRHQDHRLRSLSRGEAKLVRQEARLLATLRHPHIVSHLESFGEAESRTAEGSLYCDGVRRSGRDLEQWVSRRRQHGSQLEGTALRIFAQACMALEHVHAHRVVHRGRQDVEPIHYEGCGRAHPSSSEEPKPPRACWAPLVI